MFRKSNPSGGNSPPTTPTGPSSPGSSNRPLPAGPPPVTGAGQGSVPFVYGAYSVPTSLSLPPNPSSSSSPAAGTPTQLPTPVATGLMGNRELSEALKFRSGLQRRNSVDHARSMHAAAPRRLMSLPLPTKDDFKKLLNNGGIECSELMGLLRTNSELGWDEKKSGGGVLEGREAVRTGRNFQMEEGGVVIKVRIHTSDHNQASGNSAIGSVVRIFYGRDMLRATARNAQVNSKITVDPYWVKNMTGNDSVNAVHIPLRFGANVSGVGGASSIVPPQPSPGVVLAPAASQKKPGS